jgi:hypothetical protein
MAAADTPAVALMPLSAVDGATRAHAAGMDEKLRTLMERYEFLELLPLRERDDKRVNRCKATVACLGELAHRRGAELLAVGQVHPAETGFRITLQLVEPKGSAFVREVEGVAGGDGASMARALDLLARQAFAPEEIYAHLRISGSPDGARVKVDGEVVGALPLAEPEMRVIAGEHVVELAAPGFDTLRRRVKPGFREVSEIHIELTASDGTGDGAFDDGEALPMGPVALMGAGAGAFALGAVAGTFALLDMQEVERRAEVQQLAFPRDEGLVSRGQTLSWAANVLYVAGVGMAAGGAYWWFTTTAEDQ